VPVELVLLLDVRVELIVIGVAAVSEPGKSRLAVAESAAKEAEAAALSVALTVK